MSTIKKDYYELLKPLVYTITGIEEDSKEFKDITNKLIEKLRFNTYTLASPKYVKDSYDGIIEKFKISAQEKSAEDLKKFLNILEKKTEQKKNSKIPEILTLFLNLSKSPTHHFYNSHYFNEKEKKEEKELTWEDILKDEPLTGDHWKIPSYSSDSSSNTQIFDVELIDYNTNNTSKNETSFQKNEFLTKEIDSMSSIETNSDNNNNNYNNNDFDINNEFDNTNETLHINDMNIDIDNSYTHVKSENLKIFGESQYWNHVNNLNKPESNIKFDISNPYTLEIGIIQGIKENSKMIPDLLLETNYVNEADIIREILFMLLGLDTVFFQYDKNNNVKVNQNLSLKHLTTSCINQIIEYFTDKGSKIKDLRIFVSNMLDPKHYVSKTMQAFAYSISEILNYLDKKITSLEVKFQNNYVKENILTSKNTTTILSVKNELSVILNILSELHIFLNSILSIDEMKYNNTIQSCLLLTNLYEKMKSYFIIRNELLFNLYMNLFKNTFEPYISFIESWIFEGIINDPLDEFFIQKSSDINCNVNSVDYWELHYYLKEFNDIKIYPSFLKDKVQIILEAGKSFNLIRELGLKKEIQDKTYFLNDFPALYEQWSKYFLNIIENSSYLNQINTKEFENNRIINNNYQKHENNTNQKKENDNNNLESNLNQSISSSDYNMDDISEDILDILSRNTNTNMSLVIDNNNMDTSSFSSSQNQSLFQNMELYNDENYSSDIKELKSIYPHIISLYFPNKSEIMENVSQSKEDIEIKNIISNMSHKYTDTTISWIPMDNIFDQSLNKTILPPFHYYSELLVNLLQKHENLFQYINILQNLYLLQNGDFWNKFIEILFIKINKNDLVWQRSNELFSVFIECLEEISINDDQLKKYFMKNLFLYIPAEKVSSHLFPDIKLELNLPWPINNIITETSMTKYNDIFSYLLYIHMAYHTLTMNKWIRQKNYKPTALPDNTTTSNLLRYRIGLRMKLLHFVNGLRNYIFYMVLSNNIKQFQEEIIHYKNFDKIKNEHSKFVKKIWEHCLLSLTIIQKNIKDILNMCIIFTEITINNKKLFHMKEENEETEEEKFLERHEHEDIYEYQKRMKLFYHRKSLEETNKMRLLNQYQQINEEFDKTLNFIINSLTVLCSHVNINSKTTATNTVGSLESLILFLTP